MPDKKALKKAVDTLVSLYAKKVAEFNADAFLQTGVDPFRFTFNVAVWGLRRAIVKEIEHKLEMALENYIGGFHEDYLGNVRRSPKGSQWRKVPQGSIPGVDIANDTEQIFLQVKSKHNSMNSSSSTRLAQELAELKHNKPDSTVGCAWVIAKQRSSCIGERAIAEVGMVLKGKKVYDFVTGESNEMYAILKLLPEAISSVSLGS